MPTSVSIFGRVRQVLQGLDQAASGDEEQIALNEQLEQLMAMGSSPYGEITRLGRAFEIHTVAAVAAVVALPTTASMLSIWNGEADSGRSLIIDRVWGLRIVSTTAIASQAALIGCLGQTRVATLGTLSGLPKNALNGNGGGDTKVASYLTAIALDAVTGVTGNWRVLPGQTGGLKISAGAATVGGDFLNAEVNGRIIVPPGRAFGIHVMAPLVAETFLCGVEWHEKWLRLG
jgi:hypothetical protein